MMNIGDKLVVMALYADEERNMRNRQSAEALLFFWRFWLKNWVTLLSNLVDVVSQQLMCS